MDPVRLVQERLRALGFYNGEIDGDFGKVSAAAVMEAIKDVQPVKRAPLPVPPKVEPQPASSLFDTDSARRLAAADPLLQKVMNEARKSIAFKVLDSQRGRTAQEAAFKAGNSKAHFGQSAHNWSPAIAVDIVPIPLDWNDRKSFIALSSVILPIAKRLGVPLRWGGDWNGNGILTDEKLSDLPHYELHPWRTFAKGRKLFGG